MTGPAPRRRRGPAPGRRVGRVVAGVVTGLGAVALITGCTSGPTVVGDRYDGAVPDALSLDGPGDTTPAVGWVETGRSFFVTTYGSSSCPSAPTAVGVDDDVVVVEMQQIGGEVCTADYGPTSWSLDLPESTAPADEVAVRLAFDDGSVVDRVLAP
ncbi:hypothetical protein EDF38_0374 [Frigoribacterium sp. PhB160]|uniref:hypothetical protein n=1 Tax=Frigoribacterium sp. PhB160 TaxID=2485192 RepID=UPI000F479BFA|nr:hypothetical protein [Frigoribacterium sp. PhB160]ROS61287.1 hypothetical protein EDF38_0374 [Frigoribacterium sp. PhB160]